MIERTSAASAKESAAIRLLYIIGFIVIFIIMTDIDTYDGKQHLLQE